MAIVIFIVLTLQLLADLMLIFSWKRGGHIFRPAPLFLEPWANKIANSRFADMFTGDIKVSFVKTQIRVFLGAYLFLLAFAIFSAAGIAFHWTGVIKFLMGKDGAFNPYISVLVAAFAAWAFLLVSVIGKNIRRYLKDFLMGDALLLIAVILSVIALFQPYTL